MFHATSLPHARQEREAALTEKREYREERSTVVKQQTDRKKPKTAKTQN